MDRDKTRAFVDRFTTLASGATTIGMLAVADRIGLLASMAAGGAGTTDEIADEAGLDRRYTREILNGLVAARIVDFDPTTSTYSLPREHAAVVADDTSPYSMAGWLDMIPTALGLTDRIAGAAVKGGGVPFEEFGPHMIRGIDRGNRPSMLTLLTRRWIATMPDIVERVEAGGRIADLGCGSGAAVEAMATAYPAASVVGFDISEDSIERARAATDLDNASFVVGGTTELHRDGPFHLVTALDVIHDLADPRAALETVRSSLTADGALLMMEPRVGASVIDNQTDRGALVYGISTFHCMTQSLAVGGAGLGAAWGPDEARELCLDAGFSSFDELPIENPFSAFYRVS